MKIQIRILLIIVLPIFSVYGSIKFLSNYDQGIKSSDYIYRSSILNISFNISTPLISYKNYINEIDLSSWNNFTWSDINIKYPSFLNIEMYHAESISEVFDTVVIFNYYNNEDSSNYSIVRFFLTDKTFEEVAFSLGFDTTSAMHKKYSQIKEKQTVWITHGILPMPADSIVGFPWSGLRGTIEEREMGFSYDDFMFLYYKNESGRNIVFEYSNSISSECKFYEGDFIKMVENFYSEYQSK